MIDKLGLFTDDFIPDKLVKGNVPSFLHDYDEVLSENSDEDCQVLKCLWEIFGLTSFNNGLLWLIDPSIYKGSLMEFQGVTEKAVPFLRTALGSFLVWDCIDDEYVIMYLDVHMNSYEHREDSMLYFFEENLPLEDYWEDELNGEMESLAVGKITDLQSDECVAFVPALVLGGEETQDSMQKVKLIEHLFLLSQAHKKS